MADSKKAITLQINSAHREMLDAWAGSNNASPVDAAEQLLGAALEAATMSAEHATELLDAVPGAWERTQRAHEQYERGEIVPLGEL